MGVPFAGMIFYPKSARFVGDKLTNFKFEISNLKLNKVGVFVNAEIETIKEAVEAYGLQYVQLHGDETPEFCKQVKIFVAVIKAIRIGPDTNLDEQLKQYEDTCDYFLFDTDSKQYGGSGKQFNWEVLQNITINKPFFLSGGIGLEDLAAVTNFQHPNLFAIDVNSKFEVAPGIKDMNKVKSLNEDLGGLD
jgi:phosphoribosylanthranilate isomerase